MYREPERYIKIAYGIDGEGEVISRAMQLPLYLHRQDAIKIQQALLSIVSRLVPDIAERISEPNYEYQEKGE